MVRIQSTVIGNPVSVLVESPHSITLKGKLLEIRFETPGDYDTLFELNDKCITWVSFYGDDLHTSPTSDTVIEVSGDITHFKIDPLEGKLRFYKLFVDKVSFREVAFTEPVEDDKSYKP